jgi:hypothetical protein
VLHFEAKLLDFATWFTDQIAWQGPDDTSEQFDAGWIAAVDAVGAKLRSLAAQRTEQLLHLTTTSDAPLLSPPGLRRPTRPTATKAPDTQENPVRITRRVTAAAPGGE